MEHATVHNNQIYDVLKTPDSFLSFIFVSSVNSCRVFVRACAAAALRDVATYFTKEEGQVAVSERTSENPIHFFMLSYRDFFSIT